MVYDEGVPRPQTTAAYPLTRSGQITFGTSPSVLYMVNGSDYTRFNVGPTGLTLLDSVSSFACRNSTLRYAEDRLYCASAAFNVTTMYPDGIFPVEFAASAEDVENRRIFGMYYGTLRALDLDTFRLLWSLPAPVGTAFDGNGRVVVVPGGIAVKGSDKRVAVVNLQASAVLTLGTSGNGAGTVRAEGLPLSCTSSCAQLLSEGQSVTLSASPSPGSTFLRWDGDPDCADGEVTVSSARTCVAVFDRALPDGGRYVHVQAMDLAYSALTGKVYVSVDGEDVMYGNTIAEIDPETGEIRRSLPVGSDPTALAVSKDGATLYVGLHGSAAIRTVDLVHFRALETLPRAGPGSGGTGVRRGHGRVSGLAEHDCGRPSTLRFNG